MNLRSMLDEILTAKLDASRKRDRSRKARSRGDQGKQKLLQLLGKRTVSFPLEDDLRSSGASELVDAMEDRFDVEVVPEISRFEKLKILEEKFRRFEEKAKERHERCQKERDSGADGSQSAQKMPHLGNFVDFGESESGGNMDGIRKPPNSPMSGAHRVKQSVVLEVKKSRRIGLKPRKMIRPKKPNFSHIKSRILSRGINTRNRHIPGFISVKKLKYSGCQKINQKKVIRRPTPGRAASRAFPRASTEVWRAGKRSIDLHSLKKRSKSSIQKFTQNSKNFNNNNTSFITQLTNRSRNLTPTTKKAFKGSNNQNRPKPQTPKKLPISAFLLQKNGFNNTRRNSSMALEGPDSEECSESFKDHISSSDYSNSQNTENEALTCFTAYSARTNNGLYRDYNEDRVSIILSIIVELQNGKTQKSSFFGLFDGHAGAKCADYLKDNLHYFITSEPDFQTDKKSAIRKGILKTESKFLNLARTYSPIDISGSCLLLTLFQHRTCYVANVGDSRAIMSTRRGSFIKQLTVDHKPEDPRETKRVTQAGGNIFRNKSIKRRQFFDPVKKEMVHLEKVRLGPHRVEPGGLSVSRTIGDLPSKDKAHGGNAGCVVPTPDIGSVEVDSDSDFMVLACDGVFDELSNEDVVDAVWASLEQWVGKTSLKEVARIAAEHVMKVSFDKRSLDNITVVVILFQKEGYYRKGRDREASVVTEVAHFGDDGAECDE